MARKQYRIGRISDLMGVTPEALRYYEHNGIVVPKKSSQSGYRLYDAWDLHILIRTRAYRKQGFTLAETVKALESTDHTEIQRMLDDKRLILEQEIHEQQMLLQQLERDQLLLSDMLTNLGKFRIELNPPLHMIETQHEYDILEQKSDFYRAWIERVPFVKSGGIFDINKGEALRYGLIVEDSLISDIDPAELEGTTAIPSQQCVMTFFPSGSQVELGSEMFKPTLDFMKAHNLTPTGNPFARAILMTKDPSKEGVYFSWYQGWIPFEGECEYCLPPELLIEDAQSN